MAEAIKISEEYKELEQTLGYSFKKPERLVQAFTHPSYANESKKTSVESYERLEFLGDAVLELVISHYLWDSYPELPEGGLTSLRAELVQQSTLATVAKRYNFGKYILVGKGERRRAGNERTSTLADCLESVLGAAFLDGGISPARLLCYRMFSEEFEKLDPDKLRNYKNQLQELCATLQLEIPRYIFIEQVGPEHEPSFRMEIRINDDFFAEGTGRSKKRAGQDAARTLLGILQEQNQSKDVKTESETQTTLSPK